MTYTFKLSRRLALLLTIGPVLACQPAEDRDFLAPPPSNSTTLSNLALSPRTAAIRAGEILQFSLRGTSASGERPVAASDVTWEARGGGTISADGRFVADAGGTHTIVARLKQNSALADSAVVSVEAAVHVAAVAIAPKSGVLLPGETRTFSAQAVLSNGSTTRQGVVWATPDGGVVSEDGEFTAPSDGGSYRVIVAAAEARDTAVVTVENAPGELDTLFVNPSAAVLQTGDQQQFSVVASWSDGSQRPPAVAFSSTGGTVTPSGVYTAGSQPGEYLVVAKQIGGRKTDSARVVVRQPTITSLSVEPRSATLMTGGLATFKALATFTNGSTREVGVAWAATGGSIAVSGGYQAGQVAGRYRVVASVAGVSVADTVPVEIMSLEGTPLSLTIAPRQVTLPAGSAVQFKVSGTWPGGVTATPRVEWLSSGGTVGSNGMFSAASAGQYRVIARTPDLARADTAVVTVTAPTLTALVLSPDTATAQAGGQVRYAAAGFWSDGTTAPVSAIFSASGGTITPDGTFTAGLAAGTFRVVARFGESADTSLVTVLPQAPELRRVIVSPDSVSLATGEGRQFVASAEWTNGGTGSPTVAWSATGGTITSAGAYTAGASAGIFRVVATASNGMADTSVVSVAAPAVTRVVLTPATASVDTSGTVQFQAAVLWSDGASRPATISYSATGGTISSSGLFRAGRAAGAFAVIAGCAGCTPTDTAAITVTSPPPPTASFGTLAVTVSGLPAGALPVITVTGPNGYSRALPATGRLDSLTAGSYTVQANPLTSGADSYTPSPASQPVSVVAGEQRTAGVFYYRATTGAVPHPRVWMTPARVAHLRAQAAANTTRWQRVRSQADGQLARGTTYASPDEHALPALCAAYLATGNAAYAQRAGVVLAGWAVPTRTIRWDSGYPYRFWMPLITMGLDWCYDGLTPAQRRQAATWLMDQADWVWPETNSARNGAWGLWPSNNYYWGFMMTGPAAIAAAEDDTGSHPISGTNRPSYHRQLTLTKWQRDALAFFQHEGAGGAWGEGTNYDSGWYVGHFADAFGTAGTPLVIPWLTEAINWRMHAAMPRFTHKANLGDQPASSEARYGSYERLGAMSLLDASQASGALRADVQYWLSRIGNVPTSPAAETAQTVEELLRFNPAAPASPDLSSLPRHYLAAGAGYFVYRTSWTDANATAFVVESGKLNEGHRLQNANGMLIWKGSFWVAANANIWSNSGINQGTAMHNNLTVGGRGQSLGSQNGGTIVATQVSDQLVVVRSQARNAYGTPSQRPVSDFLRTVAYLPAQDAFVVVDRVSAVDASQAKVLRWHMRDVPQIAGTSFRLHNPAGDFRCFGDVLAPAGVTLSNTEYRIGQNTSVVSSNAVTVQVPTGRSTDVVVTVMQCTAALSAPATASASIGATEVSVSIGSTRVIVPLSETVPVRLQ